MEIKIRKRNGVIVLDLCGRLDENCANLIETVGRCVHDGYNDILCNFEDVDFIDYMGISVLVIAYKEVINNYGRMKFANIPAHLKEIFSVVGLDRTTIEIYAEEDLAVNSFREDRIIDKIKKMQLRRRFRRLPVDIKAELKDKFDKNSSWQKVEILNLSGVGAFIFGCSKFKLKDEVLLKLKLPPKYEEMILEAKVVWLPDKEIQPHLHPGMGLGFYNIPSAIQQQLLGFIERNLSFTSTDQ